MDDAPLPAAQRRRSLKGIPSGLPYQALGLDESTLYVLDPNKFLKKISRDQITRTALVGLWGEHQDELYEAYGRYRLVKGELVRIPRSIHAEHAADDLQRLCAAAGPFDARSKVRGIGAWRGERGDLVLHLGDRLWIPTPDRAPVSAPLGQHGEHIYLRRDAVLPPYTKPVSTDTARALLEYFATWRWQRAIDPVLLLGVIGAGFLAGALEHRPQLDVEGEAGVGKSSVYEAAHKVMGGRMLLSSDATPAGIRQTLKSDALCICLDENESTADEKRVKDLQLLRRASYGEGGESLRGTVDHAAVSFPMRSVFLSAGVTLPRSDPATRSRGAIVRLLGPPRGVCGYSPAAAREAMEIVGAKLLRRLADHWHRLRDEVLPAWRRLLEAHGCDRRASATYGTLLACWSVLTSDAVPTERDYAEYGTDLEMLAEEDKYDRLPTYKRLLDYLMGQHVQPSRRSGVVQTIMEKLLSAAGYGTTETSQRRTEFEAIRMAREEDAKEAHRELKQLGFTIYVGDTGARLLAISNTSAWIEMALRDTPFAAARGLADGHSRTLLRAPGARRVGSIRFAHGTSRAIALPLDLVLAGMVGPNPDETGRAWETILEGDPLADES